MCVCVRLKSLGPKALGSGLTDANGLDVGAVLTAVWPL